MTVREHDSVMFGLKRKYFWLSFWCGHLKPHFIRLMEKTVVLFFQSITEFVFIWLQSELHNCLNGNFHDENKFKICCFAHNLFVVVFFLSFLCIVEIRFEFHSICFSSSSRFSCMIKMSVTLSLLLIEISDQCIQVSAFMGSPMACSWLLLCQIICALTCICTLHRLLVLGPYVQWANKGVDCKRFDT